ncbi:MAG: hypothetical protein NZL83_01595 [Candidatus Absconditabacterales bacterium]|nr:hypothetical protein [Candidatus Absconditabacterales bacterium]
MEEKKSLTIHQYIQVAKAYVLSWYDRCVDCYHTNPKRFWGWVGGSLVLGGGVMAMIMTMISSSPNQHGAGGELDLDSLLAGTEEAVARQEMITCLKNQGATFYGGASCGYSCDDVQRYGKDMKNFSCVDCDLTPEKCEGMKVTHLPVWRNTAGKEAKDITSLIDLAGEYGCR